MEVAEDVATLSAVMAASKVAEGALASRIVADGGLRVGLPVFPAGQSRNLGEHFEIEVAVEAASGAVAGRDAGKSVVENRHAREVHDAAVGASQCGVGLGARSGSGIIHRLVLSFLGREQVGTESCRHVHGADLTRLLISSRRGGV